MQSTIDRLKLSFKNGELKVNDQIHVEPLKTPSAKDVLKRDKVEYVERLKMNISQGSELHHEGSTFTGYSASVRSIEEVNSANIRVREMAQGARHIMCAFRLPGKEFHRLQSYNDDDEHGGGNTILRLLESSEIMNRAMFVARHTVDPTLVPEGSTSSWKQPS